MVIAVGMNLAAIPLILNLYHIPWYANMDNGNVDNIDVYELSFLITGGVVWLIGLIVIFLSHLLASKESSR